MEICTSLFCNWDQKQNSQLVHVLCATGVNVGSFHTSVSSTSVALGEAIVHCLTLSCGSQTSSNIIFHVDSCPTCSQFQIHCYLLFLWISVSLVMVLLPEVSSQLNYSWPHFNRVMCTSDLSKGRFNIAQCTMLATEANTCLKFLHLMIICIIFIYKDQW